MMIPFVELILEVVSESVGTNAPSLQKKAFRVHHITRKILQELEGRSIGIVRQCLGSSQRGNQEIYQNIFKLTNTNLRIV